MTPFRWEHRMRLTTFLTGAVLALLALTAPPGWAAAKDAEASAFCITCHDSDDLPDMSRSAHVAKGDARTPDCVSCHGLSPTHARKPETAKDRPAPDRTYRKTAGEVPATLSGACLSCHDKQAKRMQWAASAHDGADVTCNSCHKIHTNRDRATAKATEAEVCYACHKTQRAQLNRPSHHPVPEGQMTCSDCHNAHGSAGPKLVKRDTINDTCYLCHAEKRGPFVQAHQPAVDNCATCHNPHGSTIAAMLTARPPMLCQQCHTPHVAGGVGALGGQPGVFAPAMPGQTGPQVTAISSGKNVVNLWQGRSCVNCHTQVHGSNNPAATNPTPRFFVR